MSGKRGVQKFAHAAEAVAMYKAGRSLREVGEKFCVRLETIRQVILRIDPTIIRQAHKHLRPQTTWDDADIATLRRLWERGDSASIISRALGGRFSRCAVVGKAHRLNLAARDSGVNRSWQHRTKPSLAVSKPAPPLKPVQPQTETLAPLGPIGAFPEGHTCRYPYGEGKTIQFCGRPGFPWCQAHHGVCLVKPNTNRLKGA